MERRRPHARAEERRQLVPRHRRGTGQMGTSVDVELGNGHHSIFDFGPGSIANYLAAKVPLNQTKFGQHEDEEEINRNAVDRARTALFAPLHQWLTVA